MARKASVLPRARCGPIRTPSRNGQPLGRLASKVENRLYWMNDEEAQNSTGSRVPGTRPATLWVVIAIGAAIAIALRWLDPRIGGLFLNSLLLAGGAALVALPLGMVLGLLLARTDVPLRRYWLILLSGMTLVPLIMVASAWDAGFGRLGWWQWLVGGDFRGRMLDGLFAAAWVHAFAAIPWVVLISFLGGRQALVDQEDAASLDAGRWQIAWRFSLAQWSSIAAVGLLSIVVLTFGEIVASDLYGVRTVAEEVYLGLPLAQMFSVNNGLVVSEQAAGSRWLTSPAGLATLCWVAACGWCVIKHVAPGVQGAIRGKTRLIALGAWRWPVFGFVLLMVAIIVMVPLANLTVRAGFVVQQGPERGIPGWSLSRAAEVVWAVPGEYSQEIIWTSVIAGLAVLLSVGFWGPMAWWSYRTRRFRGGMVYLAAIMLAIPGPVIGTLLIGLLNHDVDALIFIYDRTVIPPALACFLRVGPWMGIMFWAILHTLDSEVLDVAESDGVGRFAQLLYVVLPQRAWLFATTILATWLLMSGELSASILVVPPGIDTLPRTVFGQLHAGVYDQVAALCLFQWGVFVSVSVLIAWAWARRFRREKA